MPTHDANLEESSLTKTRKHKTCDYSLFIHCSFDSSRSKHDFRRGADCIKKFRPDRKKHTTEIINYEKKGNVAINR